MFIKLISASLLIRKILLIVPAFMLFGCSTETLKDSASMSPGQLSQHEKPNLLSAKPIETYTFTARMVHRCWLNNAKPLIKNHVFFASATRKGGEKAHIGIHRRAKLGRKGSASFAIMFATDGMGTSISTMNYKFPGPLAERLKEDVYRWTSGDATCPPPVELIAASSENIPAPIPTTKAKSTKKKGTRKKTKKVKKKAKKNVK